MEDYSAASFGSSTELIQLGKEWGKKFYPAFKKLADSVKASNPNYHFRKNRLPNKTKITIDGTHINGLNHTSEKSFIKRLHLEIGKDYDGIEIAEAIRKVYGSRNYNRISYRWEPTTDGHANLVFDVIENPPHLFQIRVALSHFQQRCTYNYCC